MAGLPKNSNTSVITQWYQLFTDQNIIRSSEAYAHWQDVKRLGLPNSQHESWKYTSLDKLLSHRFALPAINTVTMAECNALSLCLNAHRLVFINGNFASSLSDRDTGVWRINVERGIDKLSLPSPIQSEIFLHLNESLSQETTRILLPMGERAKNSLYLLHISHGREDQKTLNTLHYRHHLDIEAGAFGQVIEHFVSMNAYGHFSNARTSIVVRENAHFSHIKLAFENCASYHFGHDDILVGRNAVVRSNTFAIGAGLTKHQVSAQLNNEGSDLMINSLSLPFDQNVSDIRTYIEHNEGYCSSRQLHKIIACNRGKGVFNGLIKVAKHALKTNGHITNNNLLLDSLSEVNSKPHLEIYADDVKCSHGATIGCIDQEQIFYLCSRGINKDHAKQMIIYAFVTEITEAISYNEIRNAVLARITNILKKG